jgi:hypothetical protein
MGSVLESLGHFLGTTQGCIAGLINFKAHVAIANSKSAGLRFNIMMPFLVPFTHMLRI